MLSGTWSTITAASPSGAQMGVVLTDGTIMVHGGGGNASNAWYKLTPTASGSYTAGTWSTLASSSTYRLYDATEVMQSGKVMVLGGEYSGSGTNETFTNSGEIYDPVANTWTGMATFPESQYGDDPTELLPNGSVLAGYIAGPQTFIYNPNTNAWTQTGTKMRSDQSDEEGWVTLPDHSVLSYDVFSSVSTGVPHAQRYIPATNTWVDAGNPPQQLSSASVGYEMGPGLLLPDGRVFFAGGTNATAYYTPSTNTWAAGPAMPNNTCMADAGAAVLPNGDILMAVSPLGKLSGGGYNFPSPTYVYELNPLTNVYTNVTPSLANFSLNNGSYVYTFTVLPTGQVAMFGDQTTIAVYTESGSPVTAAVPIITGISYSGSGQVYTLTGSNLNGINEGAAYGDDNEMSSNYPLVRLTDASGNVSFARTTNWSLTGVDQGTETVTFTLPASDTLGAYLIRAVANGVSSNAALAVLVNATSANASSSPTVSVQTSVNPTNVDVDINGVTKGTFADSSFNSIYIDGDNSGDTISVTLNNNLGSTATNLQAGSGTDTININQTSATGPVIIAPSAGNDAVNIGTAGDGTALAEFLASQQIGALVIGSGGRATVGNGTTQLLQASSVITTGTGLLDLTRSDMIIHAQDLPTLTSEIASGFNLPSGGNWSGPGIISSTAAADTTQLTTLGILQNSLNGAAIYPTFEGKPVLPSDILIKYTYYGDANLDGKVDGSDYSLIDNGFITGSTGWFNGDFDYSGTVDGSDYALIDNAFNVQSASIAAQIATPAAQIASDSKRKVFVAVPIAESDFDWSQKHRGVKSASVSPIRDQIFSNQPVA